MQDGISHDVAFIFCQNWQDLVIIKMARPSFDKLPVGYHTPEKAPIFWFQIDKKLVQGMLVFTIHKS